MSSPAKSLIVIVGPTASGKTNLAVDIAQYYNSAIISADSRQFYRELKIGSAMPDEDTLSKIPHYFIGHLSVDEPYNVSRYEEDALKKIHSLFEQHDKLILCGGSGLYIDALCYGLDELPDPDPEIRSALKKRLEENGPEDLQFELKRLDPEYYNQADIQNPERLIRALEVCILTGKKYSSLRKNTRKSREFNIFKIGLDISMNVLTDRIRRRTTKMLENGLIEEARSLSAKRHLNALNTVGYKEMFACLDGKISIDEAGELISVNTRRYAKRQGTWFRRDKTTRWIPFHSEENPYPDWQSLLQSHSI